MGQLIRQDCATEILPPEPQWRRNGYWLPITTPTDSEEKAVILKAVFDSTQEWCALSAAGDYTVDWGDGNIENFASGVTAEHTYNYADADLHDSSIELGYKQAIIQVYPQAEQQLTSLNLHVRHSAAGSSVYDSGFLDIRIVGNSLTSVLLGLQNPASTTYTGEVIRHSSLQNFSLTATNLNNISWIFAECRKLQSTNINVAALSEIRGAFYSTAIMTSYPILNTYNCTDFSYLYVGSRVCKNFPMLDTTNGLIFDQMYRACSAVKELPAHNTPNGTSFANYADGCIALADYPDISLENATNIASFLANCLILDNNFPSYNLSNATNITNLISSAAVKLSKLPSDLDFSNVTTASGAFTNLTSLEELPGYNFSNCQTFTNMLLNCRALRKTGIIDAAAGTVFASIFSGCGNLEYSILQGCRYTVSIVNCKFPKENIEAFLAALGSAAAGTQTITISGNPGTGTINSKTATTTLGSKTVTMADTSNLAIGDRMTGAGSPLTTAIAVTFTDAGDTVNLVNHQLPNGHPVSFPSITTTTGIVIRTIYYVVNATTDNFQLAATVGGAALALTSDGSGTMIYDAAIESIDTNVSVTLSAPATSSSTGSKSFRSLNTAPALLKGFTISG